MLMAGGCELKAFNVHPHTTNGTHISCSHIVISKRRTQIIVCDAEEGDEALLAQHRVF